jgi:carboxylesterase type B
MVFFYGGNYKQGGSSTPLYNGDFLANNTNVITVVLNYRLGALSFFVNNAVKGNLATQDQAYGLVVWCYSNQLLSLSLCVCLSISVIDIMSRHHRWRFI